MHANIQKDGTFSVVPRMWGGLTNPRELRAIADAADKYGVPTVKVTGGQRIDLLGVKKEQLPAIWADLNAAGLVSGHAYGKALRTVKTCVGSEWCRFGTQDSTGLGVKLEKMCWGSWTPHKVKLAVSGCPRNCAEATIKDVGVVCVDAGYDIVVGGNGGIEVRVTDHLARVASEAEVLGTCRRVPAALPRGGALSRTHRAVGRAGRHRLRPAPDRGRWRRAARAAPALPVLAELCAEGPVGRARRRRRRARIPRPRSGGVSAMPGTGWVEIGRLDDIPRRGARRVMQAGRGA